MAYDPTALDLGYDPGIIDLGTVATDGATTGPAPDQNPLNQLLNLVIDAPSSINDLLAALTGIISDIGDVLGDARAAHPLGMVSYLADHAAKVPVLMDVAAFLSPSTNQAGTAGAQAGGRLLGDAQAIWNWITKISGGGWYWALLEFGLGLNVSEFDDEAIKGVNTTGTLIGFSIAIQYVVALIEFLGKGLFATRWGEPLKESISKIPEEMGLSWALGLAIDEGYKTAVGRSVEEAINRQKRGNRIEWPVLRTMLKQHLFADLTTDGNGKVTGTITDQPSYPGIDVLVDLLKNEGFPDWQIGMITALADQQLPVGDLQQMYLHDIMTADDIKTYIEQLGFSPTDAARLQQLYIDHAETSAGSIYRSTARGLFANQLITEDMYREILTHSNFPAREIDDDIAAIKLEHSVGRIQGTVSAVKQQLQHGVIDVPTALKELRLLNYSEDAATQLINTWNLPPLHKTHGLSQARILSYYKANVLTRQQAYDKLINLNINIDDINILLDHPDSAAGVKTRRRTPGLVTEAVIAGALSLDQAADAYKAAGVADADISLYLANLEFKIVRTKGSTEYVAALNAREVTDAYKYAIIKQDDAIVRLEVLGYSPEDAEILIEIANKGPFGPTATPLFATLDDAIAYLFGQGIEVIPPPDPRLAAAEALVSSSGYTFEPIPSAGGGILSLQSTLSSLSALGYQVQPNPALPGGYIINPPSGIAPL